MRKELKNPELIDAISYWSDKFSTCKRVFNDEKIKSLIFLCDNVIENDRGEISIDLIENFVAGLALIPYALNDEEIGKELDRLTQPMINIMLERLKSNNFVSEMVEQRIDGDELISIDGVNIPITTKKLVRLIEDNNLLVTGKEDVERIKDDFISKHREKYRLHGVETNPPGKTYPDKWYAFYHWILIKCGKVKPIEGSKTEIIQFGQNKYGTGEGFYKEYKDFDMNNIPAYINSLSQKDRHKWKGIIKDISKNDNDVLLWLKKQPI